MDVEDEGWSTAWGDRRYDSDLILKSEALDLMAEMGEVALPIIPDQRYPLTDYNGEQFNQVCMTESATPAVPNHSWLVTVIECCCSGGSKLANEKYQSNEVRIIRLTESQDLRNPTVIADVLKIIHDPNSGLVVLFGSLPCTGGTSLQQINKVKHAEGHEERMRVHLQTFTELLESFLVLCEGVKIVGGEIIYEWPYKCAFWKHPQIESMIDTYGLKQLFFNGCALNL